MSLADLAAEVAKKKEEISKSLQERGEIEIKGALKGLFAEFPNIEAIRWTQYAPYFNDGDPCVFRVHDADYKLVSPDKSESSSGNAEDADEYGDWIEAYRPSKDKAPEHNAVCGFSRALQEIGSSMEDVFGTDKQIICTRESIRVESYDHD